jgi:hypothetical protein
MHQLGYEDFSFPLPKAGVAFEAYRPVEALSEAVFFTDLRAIRAPSLALPRSRLTVEAHR